MKTQNVIRTVMGSLALAGICAAAPLDKAAKGVAQGRWLELTPRTTLLHGFLDERAGKHAYHMQAALIATTPSSGAVYGSLEPTEEPATNALRQKELFLYGQYARTDDGGGKFDAVILMQLSGNGMPIVLAVGTIRGMLSAEITSGPKPIAVAFDLDGDGSEPEQSAAASVDSGTVAPSKAKLITQISALHRVRDVVRAILSHSGALRMDVAEDVAPNVQRKGSFRARWFLR